jgi:hypothetical protein
LYSLVTYCCQREVIAVSSGSRAEEKTAKAFKTQDHVGGDLEHQVGTASTVAAVLPAQEVGIFVVMDASKGYRAVSGAVSGTRPAPATAADGEDAASRRGEALTEGAEMVNVFALERKPVSSTFSQGLANQSA